MALPSAQRAPTLLEAFFLMDIKRVKVWRKEIQTN
jgi:hypothetical protein